MIFSVTRLLDAFYLVSFAVPAIALVGNVPDAILGIYRTFTDRYSFIRPDAFQALGSNTLSEVGVAIGLLDKRLEITLRVDQFVVQATNLRNPNEVRFAQDCALLVHEFLTKKLPDSNIGTTNLRVASWLTLDGGIEGASKILSKVSKPSRSTFNTKKLGANKVEYWAKLLLKNDKAGWELSVGVEPSAISDAQLYVLRDYIFNQASEIDTPEKKMAFLELSGISICEWLGIEPTVEAR